MANTFSFRILFTLFFLFNLSFGVAQIETSNTPQWVVNQDYEANPNIETNEISYGLLTLLNDEQIHIPKQERFFRYVRKITDNVGVQDGSSVSIDYDPTYQQLFMHDITVIRQGKQINKLNVNDFQTIRKESNSENYIYDGSLNAIANLADIRNGDILDFSYTIKGFNPIHGDHFSGVTILNDYQPVGKINYYLISKKKLIYKAVNTDIEPKISSYNGYKTYNWQANLTETPNFEDNLPSWYLAYKNVFVSDFETWDDVVNWALGIYKDNSNLSQELKTKINNIKNDFKFERQRIKATLKFVQEDIRYLGLESGIGAYKPFTPNKVFKQRFGDCKDKSWLMVTMLRNMGVEAYPVLINSAYGESLHQFLPSPKVFDHVVVKVVDSFDNHLYYDPTISNQYGNYKDISFPDYGKALVIKPGVDSLEKINSNSKDLVEVYDIFDLPKVGGPGTLNTTTVYRDSEADIMRARYKSSSISSISKDFKSYYDGFYEGVEVLKDPVFIDDTIDNKITVEESYKINEIWSTMDLDKNNLAVEVSPYSIFDVFLSPDDKERKTPFALYYPTHKKHNITIKLPKRWNITKDDININSKSFSFSFNSKMNPSQNILYLNYEYQNKNSFVNPEDFKDYYTKIKEMEKVIGYYIYTPKNPFDSFLDKDNTSSSSVLKSILWVIGFIVLLGAGVVIFFVITRTKKK